MERAAPLKLKAHHLTHSRAATKSPGEEASGLGLSKCADWSLLKASKDYLHFLLHPVHTESWNSSLGNDTCIESRSWWGRAECGLGEVAIRSTH